MTAPLHERADCPQCGHPWHPHQAPCSDPRCPAPVALRPPEGEVGEICEYLEAYAKELEATGFVTRPQRLRAALAHLRRLAAVEAERDRLRGALDDIADMHIGDCPASLAHLTDAEWAQRCHMHLRRTAIAALAPAPAAEDAR